ncbi:hypothetical protein ACM55H_10850 [Flavobacterium sp. ZT3R17]|uniref:hypothetical protein n=1 Tax=Flavobacterium cryoconiti TaxID=3398736 RepID=UPI003A86E508
MNIKIVLNRSIYLMLSIVTLSSLGSCQSEDFADNGLLDANVDPAFTITPVAGSTNRFTLTAQTKNVLGSKWDLGDGAGMHLGKMTETIFLPDAGAYTITHGAIGKGGVVNNITQNVVVTTSDPNSGNLVQGAKFETADDISKWTVLTISASGTAWAFANGKAKITGGGWNQQAIYQAINVVSGKIYKIDMLASSTTGVSNTWFEVYASPTAPTQNNDYSADGKKAVINTWAGCGGSPFNGKLSNVGCDTTNEGKFTATVTGVIYLVIKCGGEDLKDGIAIDNVELRGVQ